MLPSQRWKSSDPTCSSRCVASKASGCWEKPATRYASASQVDGSAHWTSSTTSTVGPRATTRPMSASTTVIRREPDVSGAAPRDGSTRAAAGISSMIAALSAVAGSSEPALQREHQRVVRRLDRAEAQRLSPQHLDPSGTWPAPRRFAPARSCRPPLRPGRARPVGTRSCRAGRPRAASAARRRDHSRTAVQPHLVSVVPPAGRCRPGRDLRAGCDRASRHRVVPEATLWRVLRHTTHTGAVSGPRDFDPGRSATWRPTRGRRTTATTGRRSSAPRSAWSGRGSGWAVARPCTARGWCCVPTRSGRRTRTTTRTPPAA